MREGVATNTQKDTVEDDGRRNFVRGTVATFAALPLGACATGGNKSQKGESLVQGDMQTPPRQGERVKPEQQNYSVLPDTVTMEGTSMYVDREWQVAAIYQGGKRTNFQFPVSTGRINHETTSGEFSITAKNPDKRSNLYPEKHINKATGVIDDPYDSATPGASMGRSMRFYGAEWIHEAGHRFTSNGGGTYTLTKAFNSHGCISLPPKVMNILYKSDLSTIYVK